MLTMPQVTVYLLHLLVFIHWWIEKYRRNTIQTKSIDLVFHEGDQGWDDHCQAGSHQCRELVAQAFSRTCWEDGNGILAGQRGPHDLMLQRAEMVVAEDLLQQGGQAFRRLILSNMNSCLHVLSTKQRHDFLVNIWTII